jgi:hypothetical protein
MNLDLLVNLYCDRDQKTIADDHHVVFKIKGNKFSVGVFDDETDFMWEKNKDAMISFITHDNMYHGSMVTYKNNKIVYSNYHGLQDDVNFSKIFKNELSNIKILSMAFKNGLSKDDVKPYIKIFIILMSMYNDKPLPFISEKYSQKTKNLKDEI